MREYLVSGDGLVLTMLATSDEEAKRRFKNDYGYYPDSVVENS